MALPQRLEQGRVAFNRGEYFEAHELWEDVWRELAGAERIFVQGLIQIAAGLHLAEYRAPLETLGPWFYRRLHWEAGVVGQQLYLEAEASGIRATGIGCFFDDLTHGTFGLKGDAFQVLYHFTMGGAIDDVRLQTSPAYQHLHRREAP